MCTYEEGDEVPVKWVGEKIIEVKVPDDLITNDEELIIHLVDHWRTKRFSGIPVDQLIKVSIGKSEKNVKKCEIT